MMGGGVEERGCGVGYGDGGGGCGVDEESCVV